MSSPQQYAFCVLRQLQRLKQHQGRYYQQVQAMHADCTCRTLNADGMSYSLKLHGPTPDRAVSKGQLRLVVLCFFVLCCYDWGLAAALLLLMPIEDNPNSSWVDGMAVEGMRHPVE